MIIIKSVPGLTTADIMSAIADRVPGDQVQTGHGGIVVDETTAFVFLQRYLDAVAGNPPQEAPEETPEEIDTTPQRGVVRRGARK